MQLSIWLCTPKSHFDRFALSFNFFGSASSRVLPVSAKATRELMGVGDRHRAYVRRVLPCPETAGGSLTRNPAAGSAQRELHAGQSSCDKRCQRRTRHTRDTRAPHNVVWGAPTAWRLLSPAGRGHTGIARADGFQTWLGPPKKATFEASDSRFSGSTSPDGCPQCQQRPRGSF